MAWNENKRVVACLLICIACCLLAPLVTTLIKEAASPMGSTFGKFLDTDFEDEEEGESADFPANTGDDRDGVNLFADVVAGQKLKIADADNTKEITRLRTIRVPVNLGGFYRFRYDWAAAAYGLPGSYIQVDFYANTNIVVSLRIDAKDGSIYYHDGDDYADSGEVAVAEKFVDVLFYSTTQFKLRVNTGSWSAALDNKLLIATTTREITKVGLVTPTAHGYEGFESYTIPDAPDDTAYWNNWDAGGKGSFTIIAGQKGRFLKNITGAWTTQPIYTFGTAGNKDAGSITIIFTPATSTANYPYTYWYFRRNDAAAVYQIRINLGTGAVESYNSAAYEAAGTVTLDAANTIIITWANNTQHTITVGGATSSAITNANDNNSAMKQIEFGFQVVHTNSIQYDIDDIVTSWATAGPDVDTIDCYFDDMYTFKAGVGDVQVRSLETVVAHEGLATSLSYPPVMLEDGSVLLFDGASIWRLSGEDLSTADEVIEGADCFLLAKLDTGGTLVVAYKHDDVGAGINNAYFKKSEDYGATWADFGYAPSTGVDEFAVNMVGIGGVPYVVLESDNLLRGRYHNGAIWDNVPGTPTVVIACSAPSGGGGGYGFVAGSGYYFVHNDDNDATLFELGNSISKKVEISASHKVGATNGVCNVGHLGYYRIVSLEAGDEHVAAWVNNVVYTTAFTVGTGQQSFHFAPYDHCGSYPQFAFESDTATIYELVVDHMVRHETVDISVTYVHLMVNPQTGDLYLLDTDGVDTTIYKRELVAATEVIACTIKDGIWRGMTRCPSASFLVDGARGDRYAVGSVVQFYDQFGTLAFQGVIDQAAPNARGATIDCHAYSLAKEVSSSYRGNTGATKVFAAKKPSAMVSDMLSGHCQFLTSGGIDESDIAAFTYTMDNRSLDYLTRMVRAVDRAVIYATPAGLLYVRQHDNLSPTGLRWKERLPAHKKLADGIYDAAHQATRAAVAYSGGQIEYCGNSVQESQNGFTILPCLRDTGLPSVTEGTAAATALYNMLAVEQTVAFLSVFKQGFIQPGETIEYSNSEVSPAVEKVDLCVIEFVYDIKRDSYTQILLSSGIVSIDEIEAGRLTFNSALEV
ncbi:MAG: hypothetical protein JW839_02125 [Candidatus Lokiarchaeota archaeon]|nr:hypothetical protein [Candidatus Lokiarchaeota archaeon]